MFCCFNLIYILFKNFPAMQFIDYKAITAFIITKVGNIITKVGSPITFLGNIITEMGITITNLGDL
ncbi:hypothetical protein GCM10027035_10930 [Emticicia sediminis]